MDDLEAMEFTKVELPYVLTSNEAQPMRAPPEQPLLHYMCGECGKGYKWMANLRRHQRLECGKQPKYHCRLCKRQFYRRYELTNHYGSKHAVPS